MVRSRIWKTGTQQTPSTADGRATSSMSSRSSAVILPGARRFLGVFGRGNDLGIPGEKIGADVILVEVTG